MILLLWLLAFLAGGSLAAARESLAWRFGSGVFTNTTTSISSGISGAAMTSTVLTASTTSSDGLTSSGTTSTLEASDPTPSTTLPPDVISDHQQHLITLIQIVILKIKSWLKDQGDDIHPIITGLHDIITFGGSVLGDLNLPDSGSDDCGNGGKSCLSSSWAIVRCIVDTAKSLTCDLKDDDGVDVQDLIDDLNNLTGDLTKLTWPPDGGGGGQETNPEGEHPDDGKPHDDTQPDGSPDPHKTQPKPSNKPTSAQSSPSTASNTASSDSASSTSPSPTSSSSPSCTQTRTVTDAVISCFQTATMLGSLTATQSCTTSTSVISGCNVTPTTTTTTTTTTIYGRPSAPPCGTLTCGCCDGKDLLDAPDSCQPDPLLSDNISETSDRPANGSVSLDFTGNIFALPEPDYMSVAERNRFMIQQYNTASQRVAHGYYPDPNGWQTTANFIAFADRPASIALLGLRGCVSVLVISTKGCWMSHIWEGEGIKRVAVGQGVDALVNAVSCPPVFRRLFY